ncbi:MAG TPA: hypothetical protein VE760_06475, partial [Acidimicrobiales bacterium]|nr:hypothetical protein [Acidimicrobiales bacterium]
MSVAAAVGVLLTGVEAEGDVTTLSGAAFGLAVRSGDDVLVAPTPGGVDGAATEPSDGYGPVARTALPVRVPGVLSVGVLEASTQGAGLSAPQGSGSAVSSARAGGLAVPILSLAVTAVESRCSAGDDGSA